MALDKGLLASLGLPEDADEAAVAGQISALKSKAEEGAMAAKTAAEERVKLRSEQNAFFCEKLSEGDGACLLPAQVDKASALLNMAGDNTAMVAALKDFFMSLEQDSFEGEVLNTENATSGPVDITASQVNERLGD